MEETILKFFDKINIIFSTILTGMTNIFGIQWILFGGYLILNVFDFITGCTKARINRTESSVIGLKGIIKKICYWLLILVAFLSSYMINVVGELIGLNISYVIFFGWFTLACLLINEVRSILENLSEIGLEIPEFLVNGLQVVNNTINDNAIEKINKTNKSMEEKNE